MIQNYLKSILPILVFGILSMSYSQSTNNTLNNPRLLCEMPDIGIPNDNFVGLRDVAKSRIENQSNPCTTIVVNYTGFPSGIPAGPGPEQIAFQLAVDIWATLIESDQTIVINANWVNTGNPNNLGGASASYFAGIPGSSDNVIYPAALFEKLTNTSNVSDDIFCQFNSSRTDWFFPSAIDEPTPPGMFNFTSVVLHELGHGLGMAGFGRTRGGLAGLEGYIRRDSDGGTTVDPNDPNALFVTPWDTFIEVGGISILDESTYPDPSTSMLNAFISQSSDMNCVSPIAIQQNNGIVPITQGELFNNTTSQFEFRTGSSYSHWDEDTFNGTPTSLMTPFLGPGESVYDPGDVTLGFMEDMGWSLCGRTLSTQIFGLNSLNISPNPFRDKIVVNLSQDIASSNYDVSILDINGRVIHSLGLIPEDNKLIISNLEDLQPTLYFIKISNRNNGTAFTKKLIKK